MSAEIKKNDFSTETGNYSKNCIEEESIKVYLNEIGRYPVLSDIEVQKLFGNLKQASDLRLLSFQTKNGYYFSTLNIPLLFNSLCSSSLYMTIINAFITFLEKTRMDSCGSTIEKLKKYRYLSSSLKKSLNFEELQKYFNILETTCCLSEQELIQETKGFINYKLSFDKIFMSNLKLVVYIAKGFKCNVGLMDIINEGNLGLMRAIHKYDVSLGYKFSTYATHWIKQSIRLMLSKQNSGIKTPTGNKSPQIQTISLSDPIDERNSLYFDDFIIGEDAVEEKVFSDILKSEIDVLFKNLTEREKQVIKMRFGLGEFRNKPTSTIYVSKELGLSKEKIRLIEKTALLKIKMLCLSDEKAYSLKEFVK